MHALFKSKLANYYLFCAVTVGDYYWPLYPEVVYPGTFFFNFKVVEMEHEGFYFAQADLEQGKAQRWTKCDLPGRIEWPYNVVKDDPIPAGHPYWLKEIGPNQARALGSTTKLIKTRVLGFHPKIERLARSYMSYRVVSAAEEVRGGAGSAPSASSSTPSAYVAPPPVPPAP